MKGADKTNEILLAEMEAMRRQIGGLERENESIKASEAAYKNIFNAVNDTIFVHDKTTGRILDANQKATDMYGYTTGEFRQLDVGALSEGSPPYTNANALRLAQLALEGHPQVFTWLAKDKAGRLFWVEVNQKRAVVAGRVRVLAIVRDITERKQEQRERERLLEEVQQRVAQLDATFNSMAGGIIIYGPSGEITRLNPAANDILRYSSEEASLPMERRIRRLGAETSDGKPMPPAQMPFMRALRGETVRNLEMVLHRPPNRVVYILVNTAPIVIPDGSIIGAVTTMVNITARKQAEERLRRSQMSLAEAEHLAHLGSYELELSDGKAIWSDEMFDIAGRQRTPEAPTIEEYQTQIVHPDDQTRVSKNFEESVKKKKPFDLEYRIVTPDGALKYLKTIGRPVLDQDGHVIRVFGTVQDITERKQAEQERENLLAEIQRRAAEFEATLDSIADGLIVNNHEGKITLINPAAKAILHYAKQQEIKTSFDSVIAILRPETAEGTPFPPDQLPFQRALRGERVFGVTMRIRRLDGVPAWLSVSAAPIRDGNGRLIGTVNTFIDTTSLHQLQEQLEDLLRAVSHDLRTPLTVIRGHAQLLETTLDKAGMERERKSAESIDTSAQRMNTMIQDLVDVTRIGARQIELHRQAINLRSFVIDLKKRLSQAVNAERIRVKIPADLPSVPADPDRLERILTNLLTNALKYSPPNTEVLVDARQSNNEIVVSVTDHGSGIAPEELPHLFQRFYRTKSGKKAGGMGLGLSIAKGLVQAHGGRIWVESKPGQGSTFYFSLPLDTSSAQNH